MNTNLSSLSGKYAIVTGSTQGLGEAIARLFVERSVAGLIVCGRDAGRGTAVAAALNSDSAGQPFGRLLKPTEVARAVAFLASGESGMMTGSVVDFDQSVIGGGAQPVPPAEET